jgi:hypothetical protein
MSQNLTDAECAELARLVRQAIDGDRYPLAPRVRRWKELLAKLDPSATPPVPYLPPKPWVNSTIGHRKRGRR